MILGRWARFRAMAMAPWQSVGDAPTDRQELGEEARRLLDNPTLHEAMNRVERKLIETWKNSALDEMRQRDAAYNMYWALQQIRGELRIMIANASVAQRQ
jgi:hypothetical protein